MAVETIHIDSSTTSAGDLLTQPVSTNTKGAWKELVASTSFAADGIILSALVATANATSLIDIGTGASTAETAILNNIPTHRISNLIGGCQTFPISIASGTRLSGRFQATATTTNIRLAGYLIAKDSVAFDDCTSSVTYGANTTDSGGASVDPGASANTKGNYTEITSSTSADHQWLMVGISGQDNAARADCSWLVDIATGAALSESVIISNLYFSSFVTVDLITPFWYPPIPIVVSSGTRLSARAQCTITDATDRTLDIIVIAFSGTASGSGGTKFSAWMG